MQDLRKRRKKRGKLYFSSSKALKTSRMGRKKAASERFKKEGVNKILDFEDTREDTTLSTIDESENPLTFPAPESQTEGASMDIGMESNPAHSPASEEHIAEDEVEEETSLMEPQGVFSNPKVHCCGRRKQFCRRVGYRGLSLMIVS